MSETLGDAMQAEIKRIQAKKERWAVMAAEMEKMSPGSSQGMKMSMAVMQVQIDAAIAALASGDVVAMMAAYTDLTNYSDDD